MNEFERNGTLRLGRLYVYVEVPRRFYMVSSAPADTKSIAKEITRRKRPVSAEASGQIPVARRNRQYRHLTFRCGI